MTAPTRKSVRGAAKAAKQAPVLHSASVELATVDSADASVSPHAAPRVAPSFITRPLGLEGWAALEPVVLAALASGDPLLLVGRHGSAKSFLLERLAQALRLEYRFYNASLVSYDDLVGVPVPDETGLALRYISTPTSIWQAQVVFVDELSRCRPDLANKLFPIIHERRVQGVKLERLRYRWAAMNPPPGADDGADDEDTYVGAEPLDPALADRFAFLIEVPSWAALTDGERTSILLDQFRGRHEFPVDLPSLVAEAERVFEVLTRAVPERLARYFLALAGARETADNPEFSTRRLTMLLRSTLAVQAARLVLRRVEQPDARPESVDWETSLWLALRHGDPQLARSGRLDPATQLAQHRHAWKLSGLAEDDPWRELLATPDLLERALRAVELSSFGADELTPLVLDGIASVADPALRTATSLALYLALHRDGRLHATAFETLARDVRRVLQPAERSLSVPASNVSPARLVGQLTSELPLDGPIHQRRLNAYTRNLLEALLPDGYAQTAPKDVAIRFRQLWKRLRLGERLADGDDS